jgi:hypothetical protein
MEWLVIKFSLLVVGVCYPILRMNNIAEKLAIII